MESTCLYTQVARIVNAPVDQYLVFYRPFTDFAYFGDVLLLGSDGNTQLLFPVLNQRNDNIARPPVKFVEVFDFADLYCYGNTKVYFPIAPPGFKAIGCVVAPSIDYVPRNCYCVRESLVEQDECNVLDVFSPFRQYVYIIMGSQYNFSIGGFSKPLSIKKLEPMWAGMTDTFVDALPEVKAYNALKERTEKEQKEGKGRSQLGKYKFNIATSRPGLVLYELPVFRNELSKYQKDEAICAQNNRLDSMVSVMTMTTQVTFGLSLTNTANAVEPIVNSHTTEMFIQYACGFELVGVTSLTPPVNYLEKYQNLSEIYKINIIEEKQQNPDPEYYLYIYKPIPPPGYVALGLVTSMTENVDDIYVYCVKDEYVVYSYQADQVGDVYNYTVASYLYDLSYINYEYEKQIKDASQKNEPQSEVDKITHQMLLKMKGMPEEPNIEYNHVEIVMPLHGQYLYLRNTENKYPILNPYILYQVYSKQVASQRSLLKGVKMDKRALKVATLELDNGSSIDVFEYRVPHKRKDTASIIYYFFKITKPTSNLQKDELKRLDSDYAELVKVPPPPAPPMKEKRSPSASKARGKSPKKNTYKNSPSASPKSNSRLPSKKQESRDTKRGLKDYSEASSVPDTKTECTSCSTTVLENSPVNKSEEESAEYTGPSDIPPECGLYFTQAGFEHYAICNPKGFKVLYTTRTLDDKNAYIVRLIAPQGYCSLSDIVYVGNDVRYLQLSKYACVSLVFCYYLHLTPISSLGRDGNMSVLKPILPFGTDQLVDSGYFPLNILTDSNICPDYYNGYFLKDQIIYAIFYQEQITKSLRYSKFSSFDRYQVETAVIYKNILEAQCERTPFTNGLDLVNADNSFCSYLLSKINDISLSSPVPQDGAYQNTYSQAVYEDNTLNENVEHGDDSSHAKQNNQYATPLDNSPLNEYDYLGPTAQDMLRLSAEIPAPAQPETKQFFYKLTLCTDFSGEYSLNGILARPVAAEKLDGELIADDGTRLFVYRLKAPQGYHCLGDVITPVELSKEYVRSYVCVHTFLTEVVQVEHPQWEITGFTQSDNIWMCYHALSANKKAYCYRVICFDKPVTSFSYYKLSSAFEQLIYHENYLGSYYPQIEQNSIFDPKPILQYLSNYCYNNSTTLHSQKLLDIGTHQVDSAMVLDETLYAYGYQAVSLSQLRVVTTEQYLTEETLKPFWDLVRYKKLNSTKKDNSSGKRHDSKKKVSADQYQKFKANLTLISNMLDVLLRLGYGRDLVVCGKSYFYACKLAKFNPRINLVGIVTDKIPVDKSGALLQDRPVFYNLLLKFVARSVGGYSYLFEKTQIEYIDAIFNTFGFAARTSETDTFKPLIELHVNTLTGELLESDFCPYEEESSVLRVLIGTIE